MEPVVLTASVIAALTPYVTKAAEEYAGEVGKALFEKTKSLWGWVKGKLASPLQAEVLKEFEASPQEYQPMLEQVLLKALQGSPELCREATQLVESIKSVGPTVNVVLAMKKAESVVGLRVKEMNRGRADVHVTIEEGKNIAGAEIDKLG